MEVWRLRRRMEKWIGVGIVALMVCTVAFLWLQGQSTPVQALDYPTFLTKMKAGEVAAVTFSDADTFTATDLDGITFTFPNPRLDTFKHMLLINGVQVKERSMGSANYGLLLMLLALVGLFLWRGRRRRETGLAGKARMESEQTVPTTRFADVAANAEALESLRDLVSFIQAPEKYSRYGAKIPRGVLLYGPPGTGKTLMARALAGEAGVPFFAVNGADFVEMYVGVGASRVRSLFQKARKAGSAVIFIDEIDAIGKKRDSTSDEREQTLNALLSEMSGFHERQGVIVLAATNRIDTLDEALLRAGRFDRHIEAPLPGYEERMKILQVHAKGKPLESTVNLAELAAQTAMFSGARLESMLNEAAILAAKRDADEISSQDIGTALDTLVCGADKKTGFPSEREREITAAHEAGHALATFFLLPDNRIRKVSIIPSSKGAAGYSMSVQPEKMFHHKQELLHHIAVALAGRAAEELLYGAELVSTGAANDIDKAATLARRMVCEWGMLPEGNELYLFSQTQRDKAAQQWIQMGYELALGILNRYRAEWNCLTGMLLSRESLGEEEVRTCLRPTRGGVPAPA